MLTLAAVATWPMVSAITVSRGSVINLNLVLWYKVKEEMAVALACERGAPTAAPATPRADELSASVVASAHAARIGWEIFGSASDTARDGLKITVTGSGTFIAPADGRGTSDEAGRHFRHDAVTGGGTWETRNASEVTGSGRYVVTGLVSWERAAASVPSMPGSTAGLAIL